MDVEDLIKAVMDCAVNIRRQLGPGYLESVYKNAMQVEFYLTATGINDGLLINFGSEQLQFKRKYRIYRKSF